MSILDKNGRNIAKPDTYWGRLGHSFQKETAKWLIAGTLGFASLFATHAAERIKFALNRADLRSESYERMSEDLSEHLFMIELFAEYLQNDWTTSGDLLPVINEYNESITRLRKREFVYRSRIAKYWNNTRLLEFEEAMKEIREIDKLVHGLNDELEAVNIKKTKEAIDPARAKKAAGAIQRAHAKLCESVDQVLEF